MSLSKQTPITDPPEIRVPIDTVSFIIAKACEFAAKTASSEAREPVVDDDDIEAAILEDRTPNTAELELESYISDLSDGAQIDLVALMWLGREGGPSDWEEAKRIATEEHNEHTAEYLCGTPLLASYLEEGLAAVGRSPEEPSAV